METNTRVYGNAKNFAIVTERPENENWARFAGVLHILNMEPFYFTRSSIEDVKEVLSDWLIEDISYSTLHPNAEVKEFLSFVEGSF